MAQYSAGGYDSYIIKGGGLMNAGVNGYGTYFTNITMTGGTIAGASGATMYGDTAGGVTINASPGGSLIAANFTLVNLTYHTQSFNVAHYPSAPYDLLLSGTISDLGGYPGMAVIKSGAGLMVMSGANS